MKVRDIIHSKKNLPFWNNIAEQYQLYGIDEISQSTYEYPNFLEELVVGIKKLSPSVQDIVCLVYGSVSRGTADTNASFFENRLYLNSKHYGSLFTRMPSSDIDIAIIGENLDDLYDILTNQVNKIAHARYSNKLISILFAPKSLVIENVFSENTPNVYKRLVQESEKLVVLGNNMLESMLQNAPRSETDKIYSSERVGIKHYINEHIGNSSKLFVLHQELMKHFPVWSTKNLTKEFAGEITSPFGTTVKRIKFPNRFPYTTKCFNFVDVNELMEFVNAD